MNWALSHEQSVPVSKPGEKKSLRAQCSKKWSARRSEVLSRSSFSAPSFHCSTTLCFNDHMSWYCSAHSGQPSSCSLWKKRKSLKATGWFIGFIVGRCSSSSCWWSTVWPVPVAYIHVQSFHVISVTQYRLVSDVFYLSICTISINASLPNYFWNKCTWEQFFHSFITPPVFRVH